MKMEGRIPYCLRWPAYADKLVPLFNSTLNRRSPFYYQPPYAVLPVVDWFDYRESEYHREFNVPLGIRYSLGVRWNPRLLVGLAVRPLRAPQHPGRRL